MRPPRALLGVVVRGRPGASGPVRDSARRGRGDGRGQRLSGAGAGKIEPLFVGIAGSVGEAGRNYTSCSRGGAAPAVIPGQAGDPTGDPYGSAPGPSSRRVPVAPGPAASHGPGQAGDPGRGCRARPGCRKGPVGEEYKTVSKIPASVRSAASQETPGTGPNRAGSPGAESPGEGPAGARGVSGSWRSRIAAAGGCEAKPRPSTRGRNGRSEAAATAAASPSPGEGRGRGVPPAAGAAPRRPPRGAGQRRGQSGCGRGSVWSGGWRWGS